MVCAGAAVLYCDAVPTDLRRLGAIGDALHASPRGRRRRRVPRWLRLALTGTVLLALWVGVTASLQADPVPSPDGDAVALVVPPRSDPAVPGAASRGTARGPGTFAAVDRLPLVLPHPAPEVVGFHEALAPEALALAPTGRLDANDHHTYVPPDDAGGPRYRVLATRGRGTPATSAVDVVVPRGDAVTAPVTGTVTEVREYVLYGETTDVRVGLRPDDAPHLRVVLIHLEQPRVAPGDRVVAGTTPLATARLLPFASHVDAFAPSRMPHTHLEVTRAP